MRDMHWILTLDEEPKKGADVIVAYGKETARAVYMGSQSFHVLDAMAIVAGPTMWMPWPEAPEYQSFLGSHESDNEENGVMKSACFVALIWAAIYFSFAYIFVNMNPVEWHGFWRFVFVVCVFWAPAGAIWSGIKYER